MPGNTVSRPRRPSSGTCWRSAGAQLDPVPADPPIPNPDKQQPPESFPPLAPSPTPNRLVTAPLTRITGDYASQRPNPVRRATQPSRTVTNHGSAPVDTGSRGAGPPEPLNNRRLETIPYDRRT